MGKASRARKCPTQIRIEEPRAKGLERRDGEIFLEKKVVHVLLIIAIALVAYSNTFHSPFQFDDVGLVLNQSIRSLDNFILNTKGYNYSPPRFIGNLTFALNYYVGGFSVTGYHIVNLAIHIANALLLYALVLLTFKAPTLRQSADPDSRTPVVIAFFSALLFVSHPLQTQAVTYIVQRLTSLATFFYLLSLVMYIKARLAREQIKATLIFYALSLLCAVCAMKTKEIAFTLPATVLLYEFMFFKSSARKRLLFLLLVMLALTIIPLSLMHSDKPLGAILSELGEKTRVQTDMPRWHYLVTQMRVIVTYLRLVFVPIHQNLDYDYPIYDSLFRPPVFFSFLLLVAIAGSGFYLLYASRSRHSSSSPRAACDRLISFGIFWFFITLSVQSSIVPIVDVIFEHRVYLPLAGLFIAIMTYVVTATKRLKMENVALLLLASWVIMLTGATYARNMVWMSEISLWEDVVKKSPSKARAHQGLGGVYFRKNRVDEAVREFQTALRLDPYYAPAYSDLGQVYFRQGRLDEALREFQTALRLDPNFPKLHANLGTVYSKQGRLDEALREFQTALRLDPFDVGAHNNLGALYVNQGLLDEAGKEFQAVLTLDPSHVEAHNNLGRVYYKQGRLDEALQEFQAALRLRPDFSMAHNNLGTVYLKQGRLDEALQEFQAALRLNADDAEARRNLEKVSGKANARKLHQ